MMNLTVSVIHTTRADSHLGPLEFMSFTPEITESTQLTKTH